MFFDIKELVDISELEKRMIFFYKATGYPIFLTDTDFNVITGVGFQEICEKFHLQNPETQSFCKDSNTFIKHEIKQREIISFKCKNGLISYCTPVKIKGKIIAYLLLSQILNEKPDLNFFREHAEKYGFDEKKYIKAVKQVPVISKQEAVNVMHFYSGLANMLAKLGYQNLQNKELIKSIEIRNKAIDNGLAGIATSDVNGYITYVNNAAVTMWGYENKDELIGKHYTEFFADTMKSEFEKLLTTGKLENIRTGIKKNGELIKVKQNAMVINDDKNHLFQIIASYIDITETQNTKEKLEQKNIELEKALRKAKKSEKFAKEILSIISHEIRTPLSGIIGFSEIMKDDIKDDEISEKCQDHKEYLNHIYNASCKLNDILTNLLELSAIERGKKFEVVLKNFNVKKMLKEVYDMFLNRASDKNNVIEIHVDFDTPIYSDPIKLQQVIYNLVGNALKFTENGKIKISVFKEKQYYIFTVKDNGIGIPKEKQKIIFNMFEQVGEQNHSITNKGIGLGLNLCKKYVQALKGKIWVESEINKGSTFYVKIPVESKD